MACSEGKRAYPAWCLPGVVGAIIGALITLFFTRSSIVDIIDAIGRLILNLVREPFVRDHMMWFFAFGCTAFVLTRKSKKDFNRSVEISETKHQVPRPVASQGGE